MQALSICRPITPSDLHPHSGKGLAILNSVKPIHLLPAALIAIAACAADPANKAIVATSTAEAGPDYLVQGEYAGSLDGHATGLQVIALGNGTFKAVLFDGGLPGAGGIAASRREIEGATRDGATVFKNDTLSVTLKDAKATVVLSGDTARQGTLIRTERKSPTLGEKPPAGAIILFDGSSADQFQGGRMTQDGLLMEGTTSIKKFGSHRLHIEFMTPYMPSARGQGRGNSGVYYQGRYETQVLDSFGLLGKNNETGGVYSIKDPSVNMCLPPLVWQTYDTEFTAAKYDAEGKKVKNARLTTRLNGVVVQDDTELPNGTTAAPVKEGPDPGPLHLQNHGNPVRFRNIWVVETP